MNKKFLSAILFGALMVSSTGTFVSCKDYDDDIDELWDAMDGKAAITDLTTQVSNMQSALDAAKASAENALAKAEEAKKAAETNGTDITKINAEIKALQEKIKNLENATIDVEALKSELKQTIADEIKAADIDGLKKKVEEQLKIVTELAGSFLTMITEIDLYYKAGQDDFGVAKTLDFVNTKEKDNKFGPNGEIVFTKGTEVKTPTSVIVRVVPSNAELTPNMISLINGKGESIMNNVTVTSVEPYSDLLTRGSATGLWKINFALENYNKDDFEAIKGEDDKEILYAIAVNDTKTAEGEEKRAAISDYALTLDYDDALAASKLNFKVDGKDVDEIHNRFSESENGVSTSNVEDYIWKNAAAVAIANDKSNVLVKTSQEPNDDNRQNGIIPNVEVGVPFQIELTAGDVRDKDGKSVQPRAFYVSLDKTHAVESAPSEINAWESYKIQGLNQVVDKASKLNITIPAEAAKGDYIGFRVYAVNYDGTLVDPDGRAFYVYVAGAKTTSSADLMFKPATYANSTTTFKSDAQPLSTAKWISATKAELVKIYDNSDADKTEITTTGLSLENFYMLGNPAKKLSEVAALNTAQALASYTKVQIQEAEMMKLEDGKTYTAIINLINANANNSIVETVTVTFTKVLPAFPATVKPVTNAIVGGVLKIYPKVKENDKAIYDLDNVWHGIDVHTTFAEKIADPTKATISYVATNRTTVPSTPNVSDQKPALTAPVALVNPENEKYGTKYPMVVTYDYGMLSTDDADGDENDNTFITTWNTQFDVIFGNYIKDCRIKWAGAAPKLYYAGSNVNNGLSWIKLSDLEITDWYNQDVNLFKCDYIAAPAATNVKVNLLTGADYKTVDEFYTATVENDYVIGKDKDGNDVKADVILLKATREAAQGADVLTKIKFTITDIFGYKVSQTFEPFTMTYQK